MNRSATRLLIAMALTLYGVYIGTYVPPMLIGPAVPALLIGFAVQAVCALVSALGVWRGARWAAGVVVLLGASIAGTWLFEGFILGIVAYLHALLVAVLAAISTIVIANYVSRSEAVGNDHG